jgi:hypothetical protein
MARTRLIKPEFFKHGDLYDAEKASGLPLRIAFAGLWCQADREGRFVWKPRELKLDVLPYDDADFAAVLDALERAGFVTRYVVDGKEFGFIPSLKQHQHFNVREGASKLPAPPEYPTSTVPVPSSHRTDTPDTDTDTDTVITTVAVAPVMQGKAGKKRPTTRRTDYSPEFESWWSSYPAAQRDSKVEAFAQWQRRLADGHTPEIITAGTGRYLRQCAALDRFVKNATTVLGPKLYFLETWEIPPDKATGNAVSPARLWLTVCREFDLFTYTGNAETYRAKMERAKASGRVVNFDTEFKLVRPWERLGEIPEQFVEREIANRLAGHVAKAAA